MKRVDLIAAAQQIATRLGFTLDGPHAIFTVKKALRALAENSQVSSPRIGWWQIVSAPSLNQQSTSECDLTECSSTSVEIAEPASIPEDVVEETSIGKLEARRSIGEGPECVYVYYHDAHAELAKSKGNSVWECKIGCTIGEPEVRIIGQGAMTCFPRPPIIGLIIRTLDSRDLERVLHAALTSAGKRINAGGGAEWFVTSPDKVERWFQAYSQSLTLLD
jgi:hypothetical protein